MSKPFFFQEKWEKDFKVSSADLVTQHAKRYEKKKSDAQAEPKAAYHIKIL